jgi:hypothetical protein
MTHLLFPLGGVRLTTNLIIAHFLTLAITWGNRRPALACLAWLFSFEAVFEVVSLVTGHGNTLGPIHASMYVVLAAVIVPWTYRRGVRPSWPLFAAALIFFAVWILTGFHVNQHTGHDFSASAEVWNELSKTLWATAYLVPLLGYAPVHFVQSITRKCGIRSYGTPFL